MMMKLYLPTIQNACSSLLAWVLVQLRLYLPTIQNACSSTDEYKRKMARLYLPTIQDACSSQSRWHTMPLRCTYPLFRMHVHPQINIILYNRHLLISELSYFCFITSETSLLLAFFRFCLRCSTDLTSGVHLPRELLLIPKFLILIAAFTSLSNFARHEGHTHER